MAKVINNHGNCNLSQVLLMAKILMESAIMVSLIMANLFMANKTEPHEPIY